MTPTPFYLRSPAFRREEGFLSGPLFFSDDLFLFVSWLVFSNSITTDATVLLLFFQEALPKSVSKKTS